MGDILVVGLAGRRASDDWSALTGDRPMLARQGATASAVLPAGASIATTYDAVFELVDPAQAANVIADAISEAADGHDVVYLTPGFGSLGDAVVARLAARRSLSFAPGLLTPAFTGATVSVVDALDLAAAERSEPFVGNLPALDPCSTILVTNWHGASIIELASQRLARVGVAARDLEPDDDGFVVVPAADPLEPRGSLAALEHIVARLRRDDGCPWDREQTAPSLLPALAEETQELRHAIEVCDVDNIVEELGDVLVTLLMQAQIASEAGQFRFGNAIASAQSKLVRRHPHVFGDAKAATPDEVLTIWRQVKADEKAARADAATLA